MYLKLNHLTICKYNLNRIQFKCNTNPLQADKKYARKRETWLEYDTNTIQMRYKYITNRQKSGDI